MKRIKSICIWAAVILISALAISFVFEEFGIWDALFDKRMEFHCYSVITGTEQGENYQITVEGRFKQNKDGYFDLKLVFPDGFPFQWTNRDGHVSAYYPSGYDFTHMMFTCQLLRVSTAGDPNVDLEVPIVWCALDKKAGYFYMLVCPEYGKTDYCEFYGSVEQGVPMETIAEHFASEIEFYRGFI